MKTCCQTHGEQLSGSVIYCCMAIIIVFCLNIEHFDSCLIVQLTLIIPRSDILRGDRRYPTDTHAVAGKLSTQVVNDY